MRRTVLMAAAIVAVATVGACSQGGSGKRSVDGFAASANGAAPAAAGGKAALNGSNGSVASGGSAAGDGAAPAADAAASLADGTAKIRTAQLTVAVRRGGVAAAANRADAIATAAGGEVDADNRSTGPNAEATLQLRVPPTALQQVLDDLSALGTERSRQSSTTDVTEKVADVNSRVASAQRSIAALRTLYSSATKVGDVIAIETELSTREADLESLQAQQRALARQTDMAAVTLDLQTAARAVAPVKPAKHRTGFVGGLQRGWDGFVRAAGWVATGVGTLLPFLALLFVLALAARVLWRRLPHHPHGPSPLPSPSE